MIDKSTQNKNMFVLGDFNLRDNKLDDLYAWAV